MVLAINYILETDRSVSSEERLYASSTGIIRGKVIERDSSLTSE